MPYIHRWDTARPELLVHVLHGMAEHGARYARLAAALNAQSMAVWAHDHRGHGLTANAPGELLGHFADSNGWRLLVDDAWNVSREMMAAYPGVPIALFAHSMGSFAGQQLLGEHGSSYRAVVLCGTNGPPDLREGILRAVSVGQLALGPRNPGKWIDRQMTKTFNRRFEPRKTNFDWLSRDEDEIRKYDYDPLAGFPLTATGVVRLPSRKSRPRERRARRQDSEDAPDPRHLWDARSGWRGRRGREAAADSVQRQGTDDFVAALP